MATARDKRLTRRITSAIWPLALFYSLGFAPTLLFGVPPQYTLIVAAALVIPFGTRARSTLHGVTRGGIFGLASGLGSLMAVYWLLQVPVDVNGQPATATAPTTAGVETAPALPTTVPSATVPAVPPSATTSPTTRPAATQPAPAAAPTPTTAPATQPGAATAPSTQPGMPLRRIDTLPPGVLLQFTLRCLVGNTILCAVVAGLFARMKQRRLRRAESEWERYE